MAGHAGPIDTPQPVALEGGEPSHCVARQPILNQHGRLHAYELLFRGELAQATPDDGEAPIRELVDDTVVFGLERFTNGFPAFVACAPAALTGELVRMLPPELTVLAISAPASPDLTADQTQACRELKAQGFRFALDNATGAPHPLIAFASYVRVDFIQQITGREQLRKRLGAIQLIAKNVATPADHASALAEGFTLFQGDYLFRPALVANRKVPANRLFQLEILQALYRDPVDIRQLSQLVMREASLTFRLLRLVNSPMCAIRQEVRSVESALIIVGLDTFRRFATLAILSEPAAGEQSEVLHLALLRARFCELAAAVAKRNPAEQYLLGLFSLLPVMMHMPMAELTPTLPLRDEVRQALEGAPNRERCLLHWLERHEHGDWDACDAIALDYRLSSERLARCYGEAVEWAQLAMRAAGSS